MGFFDDFTTVRPSGSTAADYYYHLTYPTRPFEWSGGLLLSPSSDPAISGFGAGFPADGFLLEKQFAADTSMMSVKLAAPPPGGQVALSTVDKAQEDAGPVRGPFVGQGDAIFTYVPGTTWSVDHAGVIIGNPATANAMLQVSATANGDTLSTFLNVDPSGFPYWLVLRISDEATDRNVAELWNEDPWTSTAGPIAQLEAARGTLTGFTSPAPRLGYAQLLGYTVQPIASSDFTTFGGQDTVSGIHWTVTTTAPTALPGGRWSLDDWRYDVITAPPGVAGDIALGPHNVGIVRP